ncbi:peptidoglycan glycosyltransferase PbpC [Yersinia ruckeri]|uniref:peptidoglycan glycosyltransferase PbpC n=1 Tax=Yersinia ruckeri TaxID=29486 RepID=UPI00200AD0EF|nr:peptidoglycan glycosyltransferase PbpC [Yersinia ruckeri]EKN4695002.1 peptidoglycan glycosyltransferase PbpC [Yersinia ruckeri]MCK8563891.1 peptidoglycan glycosyltransferase PbpC [Yersinia ruckeri]MCW6539931.1 peptidoglycan glycosyltransferase PbpC [Yersinia ruckeri]MCW6556024.1 peptidoglycan glycosyltransferase PbpC [Yersinia ruckeri]MCW6638331.1 peptidoglycan glycosyltransferase PbpC [Yersinia ruckeri]
MNNPFLRRRRVWLALGFITLLLPAAVWLADRIWPLPLTEVQMARIVVAEDGSPLWRFADDEGVWRYPVSIKHVSPYYLQALLTYEDRWFYQHPGVNPFSLARAAWQDLRAGKILSGGSTLSMQVARLIEPHSRTLTGKLRQIWRTFQLEWHLSKDQILEIYLNRAPFGGTLQGIGAASWTYLGKSPTNLTQAEAALLAVLPQSPSHLRPDRYPQRAKAARDKVLTRLAQYKVWPVDQVTEIQQEDIWLAPRKVPQLAPLLARRLITGNKRDVIRTTLDAGLQRQLEDMAQGWRHQLPEKTSLGILVVDHTTMEVKAYLGSVDFGDDSRFGHVDMISAWRSPGSTLKPFLYALALDDGLIHGESLLQDVPRRFGDYRPGNFDTGFHGPVSASEALVRSLNLPAVQLLEAYGAKRLTANLRNVGLRLRFPAHSEPNLALILGGTGSRLDQLVAAFSAFARGGMAGQLRFLPEQPLSQRRLFSPGAAWIVRRIMAGEGRPVPDDVLPAVVPLAWKTGTSYGYRDAWALGLNARYTLGIWVGRPDGTPVAGQFGYATAVPILHQVNNLLMSRLNQGHHALPTDPRPTSVSREEICWPGGQPLPSGDTDCRQRRQSWVLDGTLPPTLAAAGQENIQGNQLSLWLNKQGQRVAADCPDATPVKLSLWPLPLEPWLPLAERRAQRLPPVSQDCPPLTETDSPPLLILGIRNGATVRRLPGKNSLDLRLEAQGGQGARWWFLNGEQIATTQNNQSWLQTLTVPGRYQLNVLDESGQVSKIEFQLLK